MDINGQFRNVRDTVGVLAEWLTFLKHYDVVEGRFDDDDDDVQWFNVHLKAD